jgi:hypothetical protein
MDEKTELVKGGSGEGLKPTPARVKALHRAQDWWTPHGASEHLLADRLRGAGLIVYEPISRRYSLSAAGRAWLKTHNVQETYLELANRTTTVVKHFRYYTKDDRSDLATLARCNNINGPICPSGCLTSVEAEVTCKRCLRIMADKPVGTRL